MKAYVGKRGIFPLIFKLDTRLRRVVSFTPQPLCPLRNSPTYQLNISVEWPLSQYDNLEQLKFS
jgi:hypothetical protein